MEINWNRTAEKSMKEWFFQRFLRKKEEGHVSSFHCQPLNTENPRPLKCGGRMELSESNLAPVSNTKEPQLGSDVEPSSPGDLFPPSDLNQVAEDDEALGDELQNKLDLKDGDEVGPENEEKVSSFTDGEQVCDEESGKGEEVYGDNRGWDTNSWDDNVNDEVYGGGDANGNNDGDGYGYGYGDGVEKKEEDNNGGTHYYPLRPDAEDCSFYIKTGNCKFGSNCKFNHPIRRKNQVESMKMRSRRFVLAEGCTF